MDDVDVTVDPQIPGDEELQRRLEAYADERLRPDPLATARARARVMVEARSPRPLAGTIPEVADHRLTPRSWRPLLGLLAATLALVVAVGGAAAASGPGGALYGARLWLEEVTLPSDPDARAEAELRRIEARFGEAEAAAARGDQGALAAALAAYQSTVDEVLDSAPSELRQGELETVLSKHLVVLNGLLDTAPGPAIKGLRNAIENSGKVIDRLDGPKPGASPPGGGKPSPKPSASPRP